MALAARLSEIKTVLSAVSGIGTVHDYIRFARRWSTILDQFKKSDRINATMISRTASASRQVTLGETERAHVFAVSSVYGLADASATEKTFQNLIDAQYAAFQAYELTWNLSGITSHPDWGPMSGAVGLQIDAIDIRLFGETLCHYAACRVCVVEIE
jgi:hypothetical protein